MLGIGTIKDKTRGMDTRVVDKKYIRTLTYFGYAHLSTTKSGQFPCDNCSNKVYEGRMLYFKLQDRIHYPFSGG